MMIVLLCLACVLTVQAAGIRSYIATTGSYGYNGYPYYIRIMANDGTLIENYYNINNFYMPIGVAFAPNGDLYFTARDSASDNPFIGVMQYKGNGQWNYAVVDAWLPDLGGRLAIDSQYNVYVEAANYGAQKYPFHLWKYNSQGVKQWDIQTAGSNANTFDIRVCSTAGSYVGAGDVWLVRPYGNGVAPGVSAYNPATGALDRQVWNSYTPSEWVQGFDFGPDGNMYMCTPGYSLGDICECNLTTSISTGVKFDAAHLNYNHNYYSNAFGADYNQDGTLDFYCADGQQTGGVSNIEVYSGVDWSYLGTISYTPAYSSIGGINAITSWAWTGDPVPTVAVTANLLNYSTNGALANVSCEFDLRDVADTTTIMTKTVYGSSGGVVNNGTALKSVVTFSGMAPGQYLVRAKGNHWLSNSATVTAAVLTYPNVVLSCANGDINNDNYVEDQDYSLLGVAWYSGVGDGNYNPNADLNGDGYVEDQDYSIMGLNWYQGGS